MSTKHITLPISTERLQSDERYRSQFTEMFGSSAVTRALDSDGGEGVYDFTAEEIENMTETEYTRRQDEILSAMEKNRVRK